VHCGTHISPAVARLRVLHYLAYANMANPFSRARKCCPLRNLCSRADPDAEATTTLGQQARTTAADRLCLEQSISEFPRGTSLLSPVLADAGIPQSLRWLRRRPCS